MKYRAQSSTVKCTVLWLCPPSAREHHVMDQARTFSSILAAADMQQIYEILGSRTVQNSLLCLVLCPVRALFQENLEFFQISDETHNHKKGRYYTLVNHCKTWLPTYSNYMPKKVKSELFCWTLNSTGPDRRKKLIHFVSYMVIGGSEGLLWQHDL